MVAYEQEQLCKGLLSWFQELPACLGSLKRLKVLAADQNRITSVSPALLSGCTALATLTLHENPISIEARAALHACMPLPGQAPAAGN